MKNLTFLVEPDLEGVVVARFFPRKLAVTPWD